VKSVNHRAETGEGRSGCVGFVAVVLGGRLFMRLAAGIVGSAFGEHELTARHGRVYANVRRFGGVSSKLADSVFNPETGVFPIKGAIVQDRMTPSFKSTH
jgi:hypothetical protein